MPAAATESTCRFSARLADARRWPTQLIAADYSTLRIARARNQRASGLIQTSLTALGVQDASIDVVLCNQVLEHVPDCQAALREVRRVLRPGGLLLVGVPNEGSALGLLRNHVLQRSILRSTDHVNMFTRRLLLDWLRQADLNVMAHRAGSLLRAPHGCARLVESLATSPPGTQRDRPAHSFLCCRPPCRGDTD